MNHGDENIEYDEKLCNEMVDKMENKFYEFVGDKEIHSDNIKNLEYSEMHCSDDEKTNKDSIQITKQHRQ